MATIQQAISLADGVSPVLGKIARNVDKTIGRFNRAAGAATRMETAAAQGSMGVANGVEKAVSPIGRLRNMVSNLNAKLRTAGSGAFNGLRGALSGVTGQFAIATVAANAFMAVFSQMGELPGRLIKASDAYAGIMARLRLVAGSAQKAAELNELIYSSAQRARGSYDQMADSVSRIAMTAKKAFPDPKEVVPFMEGVQKLFVIGGTGIEQQKDALLQLTQALGSGKLQGDEFRSIAEAAPLIEQMVARYMQLDPGKLKEISSKGEITADLLKNAILTNMGEIDSQFQSMGTTWGQRWQQIENAGQKAFAPVLMKINELANSPGAQRFSQLVVTGLAVAAAAVDGLINNIIWLGNVLSNMSAVAEPVLMGLGLSMLAIAANSVLAAGGAMAHAVASAFETASILALILAQEGLNAALYACPLSWLIGIVVALVGVFYLAVAVVNHFAGTSISATGLIFGAFAWLFTSIINYLKVVANVIIAWVNFFGSVWQDPLAAVYNLFVDIWNGISSYVAQAVNGIIDMIMKIPGIDKVIGGVSHVSMPQLERKEIKGALWHVKAFEYGDANYNASRAYDVGANGISLPDMNGSTGSGVGSYPGTSYDGPGEGSKAAKDTAGNTGRMADAMDIAEEDLKYLRDMATQEAINRYTTAEVKIDMGGISNNISNGVDVDGMMTYLNDSLIEAMKAGAEEVHPV